MSTFIGKNSSSERITEKDLEGYFSGFAKACDKMQVGLEAEFFAVDKISGKGLPYNGNPGVQAMLLELSNRFQYERILESENIIALKRGAKMVTLEPGGQIELSAPPVTDVFEIEKQVQDFVQELVSLKDVFPTAAWISLGMQPFSSLKEVTWVPKERYSIMWEHFKTHGKQSHEMMKRTGTNQVSVDYPSEEFAMASLRIVLALTSIVSAIFANSSISDGKPNGFMTRRIDIWNHTDPDRAGLLPQFTEPNKTFKDYLDYLLDMPMMFLVRDQKWLPIKGTSFRKFIQKGYAGYHATRDDFELHLSGTFPEARLKQYLEIRGADAQSPDLIPAIPAFWKGILYNCDARDEAWKMVSFAKPEERMQLHLEVARKGLKAELAGKPIFPLAKELVDLSCASLAKQKQSSDQKSECVFLERIRESIMRPEKSPAEILLEKWEGEFAQKPERLVESLSIG